jgi:hypothetical protein
MKLGPVDVERVVAFCPDVTNCCLTAYPCVAPCSLTSWGDVFLLVCFCARIGHSVIKLRCRSYFCWPGRWPLLSAVRRRRRRLCDKGPGPASPLGVDAKVIVTQPCIFCMDNHY